MSRVRSQMSDSDNKSISVQVQLDLDLPTGTELGNSHEQVMNKSRTSNEQVMKNTLYAQMNKS